MPAVLVEMGFLSNPDEEIKLIDPAYQKQLARTIGQAVVEFRERHGHLEASTRSGAAGGLGPGSDPGSPATGGAR
jgi:N-acetylmuramoyl-L-alanine amidase